MSSYECVACTCVGACAKRCVMITLFVPDVFEGLIFYELSHNSNRQIDVPWRKGTHTHLWTMSVCAWQCLALHSKDCGTNTNKFVFVWMMAKTLITHWQSTRKYHKCDCSIFVQCSRSESEWFIHTLWRNNNFGQVTWPPVLFYFNVTAWTNIVVHYSNDKHYFVSISLWLSCAMCMRPWEHYIIALSHTI